MKISSQITFLYMEDMDKARHFFDNVLSLEVVYDPIWACVWRTGRNSFLGVIDNTTQHNLIQYPSKDSILISFTTENIQEEYNKLLHEESVTSISPIRFAQDIGLWSFSFHGPGDYHFYAQEFTNLKLRNLF